MRSAVRRRAASGGLAGLAVDAAGRRHRDRLDDLRVARAATQIARDRLADRVDVRPSAAVEVRLTGDQHARRADAALRATRQQERPLQRRELTGPRPRRQPLDGEDLAALDLRDRHETRVDHEPVDENRAGAALTLAAALLCAGQAEILAEDVQEPAAAGNGDLDRTGVDGEPIRRHLSPSSVGARKGCGSVVSSAAGSVPSRTGSSTTASTRPAAGTTPEATPGVSVIAARTFSAVAGRSVIHDPTASSIAATTAGAATS